MAINEVKKTRVTFSLKKETVAKLEELHDKSGISKSALVELALKNYFRNK